MGEIRPLKLGATIFVGYWKVYRAKKLRVVLVDHPEASNFTWNVTWREELRF